MKDNILSKPQLKQQQKYFNFKNKSNHIILFPNYKIMAFFNFYKKNIKKYFVYCLILIVHYFLFENRFIFLTITQENQLFALLLLLIKNTFPYENN